MSDQASNILQKYITPSMFWTPKEIDYSDKIVHSPFLFWLVEVSKPKIIVQLGANQPAYHDAYCYAVRTLSYDTYCYVIDSCFERKNCEATQIGHDGLGLSPFAKKEYTSFSSLLHASFDTAKNHFDKNTIDLLHISGNISRKKIKVLISEWKDRLSDQAVILVDQIYQFYGEKHTIGWEDVKDSYPSFSFFTADGLGIIGFGENQPGMLKSFFSEMQNEKKKVCFRIYFTDLGIKLHDKIRRNYTTLENQYKKSKEELKAIYESKSWKLTKPLRLLNIIFHKSARKNLKKFLKSKLKILISPIGSLPDLKDLKECKSEAKIAVVFHIYYPDLWNEISLTLTNLSEPFDLFISLVKGKSDHIKYLILADYPQAKIKIFPNHGKDILPFIHFLNAGIFNRYDAILKLHTKKSLHSESGEIWRHRTYFSLCDSKKNVGKIIQSMRKDKSLGIVCAPDAICDQKFWYKNYKCTKKLAKRINFEFSYENIHFTASTMFWINPKILELLQSIKLTEKDFEKEQGQVDSTTAHAVERLIGILCESYGMKIREVSTIV